MNSKLLAVCCLASWALGVPLQALADTIQPYSVFTQTVINFQTEQNRTTVGTNTLAGGGSSASVTADVLSSPYATAEASTSGQGDAVGYATVQYYFEVVGPAGVQVPIIVTANGGVTLPSVGLNFAQLAFGAPSGGQQIGYACQSGQIQSGGNGCAGQFNQPAFSIATPETVTSNVAAYSLTMTLFVVANPDFASGFIDPIITIDPNFALANEFQLVFSDGVGNSPAAVPGPIAGAGLPGLVFACIGLLAFARRSGKNHLNWALRLPLPMASPPDQRAGA